MQNSAELFIELTDKLTPPEFSAQLLSATGKADSFEIYNKIFEAGKKGDYSVFTALGDDRSVDYLRTLLLYNDIEIKQEVLFDLSQVKSRHIIEELLDILLYLLEQENDSHIQWKISNLIIPKIGLKAIKPMLEFLRNDDIDLEVRESAACAFVRRTPEAIKFLITDNSIPLSIIEVISESSSDSMDINEFIELLKYDKEYALIVIRSVENIDRNILRPLIKLLEDNDPSIRASTAYTLGVIGNKIGNPTAVAEHIWKLLKDNDEHVRQSAVDALELLCDPRTIQPILELLKNGDKDIELPLAFALGQISYKAYNTVKDALLNAYHKNEISIGALAMVTEGMAVSPNHIIRNPDAWFQYHLENKNEAYSYTSFLTSDDIDKVSGCCKSTLNIGSEAIAILNENNEKESIHAIICPAVKAAYWS